MDAGPEVRRGQFDTGAPPGRGERFTEIARVGNVVVESIVSSASPLGDVYRQAHDEWVLILEGTATLDVGGSDHALSAGDWLFVPELPPYPGPA